jgi:hypothetical protein
MEKKTLGILALALVGIFAVSLVVAMPFGNSENREAAREAVEDGDYDAWKEAVAAELTEENFDKMVAMRDLKEQIREAREVGDDESVEALREELKELVPEGFGRGRGKGLAKGFGKGMGEHRGCPFAE